MKLTPSRKPANAVTHSPRRFHGAPARAIPLLRNVEKALDDADLVTAERMLALALVMAPEHAYSLHLLGRSHYLRGRWKDAEAAFNEALRAAPDDVDSLIGLGKSQSAQGDGDSASATLRRALDLQPSHSSLMELGIALDASADAEGALWVADRMLVVDPASARARLLRARCLQALGRIDDTAAEYRELIRRRQEVAAAWFALMDIKTIRLDDSERAVLRRDYAGGPWNDFERCLLGFAHARACEQAADYATTVAVLEDANRLARQRLSWDSEQWSRNVAAIQSVFESMEPAAGSPRGAEVIFIVGLPRSGTTLIEQILAAHSQVEGANELPDLAGVVEAESTRRRQPFAVWAGFASAADWERLGKQYLERTKRWRTSKPIHTDKMPENWPYAHAIAMMLPAARIIDVRRDPLETTWSCFKQLFAPQRVAYSYRYDELAAYWHDYDLFMREAVRRHPSRIRCQSYEALIADSHSEIADLLRFCDLSAEPACLEPHRTVRSVRTASSAQVRQPFNASTARSAAYGQHLDSLRHAIEKFQLE